MLPTTGSTITAATSPRAAANSSRTEPASLKRRGQRVARRAPAATPGLSGTPSVAAPEPALTSNASAWP